MSLIDDPAAPTRICQVSSTKTTTYDMPCWLYEQMADVMTHWPFYHSRRDKCTVEKVIRLMEAVIPNVRSHITVESKPTEPGLRGLRADVWYDPYGYSKETVQPLPT